MFTGFARHAFAKIGFCRQGWAKIRIEHNDIPPTGSPLPKGKPLRENIVTGLHRRSHRSGRNVESHHRPRPAHGGDRKGNEQARHQRNDEHPPSPGGSHRFRRPGRKGIAAVHINGQTPRGVTRSKVAGFRAYPTPLSPSCHEQKNCSITTCSPPMNQSW